MNRCSKCEYRSYVSPGFALPENKGCVCDYIGYTGKRRPRKKDKKGREIPWSCDAYEPFTGKYSGAERNGTVVRKGRFLVADHAMPFYKQGLNDGQIAKSIGCKPDSVRRWRIKNNLPPNQPRDSCKIDWNVVTNLYLQGCSDKEIAASVDCSESSIKRWRHINGHRANRKRVDS